MQHCLRLRYCKNSHAFCALPSLLRALGQYFEVNMRIAFSVHPSKSDKRAGEEALVDWRVGFGLYPRFAFFFYGALQWCGVAFAFLFRQLWFNAVHPFTNYVCPDLKMAEPFSRLFPHLLCLR